MTHASGPAGAEVVQLYAHDAVASVTRPVAQLLGFARVALAPGDSATVSFAVPTTRLAFTGRDLRRIVEPGRIELFVGRSCAERLGRRRSPWSASRTRSASSRPG